MAAHTPTSSAGGGDFDDAVPAGPGEIFEIPEEDDTKTPISGRLVTGMTWGEIDAILASDSDDFDLTVSDGEDIEEITTGLSEFDGSGDSDLSSGMGARTHDHGERLIALDSDDFVRLEEGDFEDPMDGDFSPLPNRKNRPLPYKNREEMEGVHEITVHALRTMFKDYGDLFAGLQNPATQGRNPGQYPTRIVFGRLLETIGKEPTQESLQRFLDACAMINQYSIGREYLWNLTLDANYPHRETIISVLTPGRKDGDVTKRVIVQQDKVKRDPVVRECCADGTH